MTKLCTYQTKRNAVHSRPLLRTVASAAVALPLAMGSVGAATIALTPVAVTEAQAFGWSDIKKGAKKVGHAAKKVGKAAASNAKDFGGAFKRDMKKIGSGIKKNAKGAASNARDFGGALKRDVKKIGSGIKKAWCSPGFTCRKFNPPTIPPRTDHMRDGLLDYARRGGVNHKPAATTFKPGIARDRSAYGRPVGKTRQTRKVSGIRKRDVRAKRRSTSRRLMFTRNRQGVRQKAARRNGRQPYWKKYRENLPATKRRSRPNKRRTNRTRVGRDKSTFGRPVYSRKVKMRRKFKSRRVANRQKWSKEGRVSRGYKRRDRNFSRNRSRSRRAQFARRMNGNRFGGHRSRRRSR